MFKNILNLQNHSSLIYHYLRNVNRNTLWFPTNQVTMSWSTRSQVRLLHFSMQQQSLRKQTKTNQMNSKRNCCPSLILEAAHTWWMCQRALCWLSHPLAWLLFWMPLLIPQSTMLMTRHHFQMESTQHQLPSPGTAGPLLPSPAALPTRNAFDLHLGTHTIHQQEWQQSNTNTSWLQSAQCYINTLTFKVLPGTSRDAEDRRLKNVVRWNLNLSHGLQSLVKHQLPVLKTHTLKEVKNTMQACLVVCAALKW